ncbi:MAG: transcriptional regulator, TetR family [Bryobacterales bacterium]|nr:transcriptional regulator, TetR family [Bryobacterales bacterium]
MSVVESLSNSMSIEVKESCEETAQRGRGRPRDEVARTRILEAALEVLQEVGFANTTTDAIAERAGASKATIYRWWSNKAAVVIEALRKQVSRDTPFADTGDLVNDIHLQLQGFVEFLTGWRGRVFKAFIAAAQNDPAFAESFRTDWILPRREEAKEIFERHKERGALAKNVDLELLLDAMYGPIYFRLLAGHGRLDADFAKSVGDMTIRSLVTS